MTFGTSLGYVPGPGVCYNSFLPHPKVGGPYANIPIFRCLHPRNLTSIPKISQDMMVFKMYLLSNMASLGIHRSFGGCSCFFLSAAIQCVQGLDLCSIECNPELNPRMIVEMGCETP